MYQCTNSVSHKPIANSCTIVVSNTQRRFDDSKPSHCCASETLYYIVVCAYIQICWHYSLASSVQFLYLMFTISVTLSRRIFAYYCSRFVVIPTRSRWICCWISWPCVVAVCCLILRLIAILVVLVPLNAIYNAQYPSSRSKLCKDSCRTSLVRLYCNLTHFVDYKIIVAATVMLPTKYTGLVMVRVNASLDMNHRTSESSTILWTHEPCTCNMRLS